MSRTKAQSLDHAVRLLAAKKLANSDPAQILAQLERQGIGSLEDLARKVVENAASVVQSASASYDDDIPMICYKFSSFRPVVGLQELEREVSELSVFVREGGGAVTGGGNA